ncbi:lysozyme inhibitor LprI family protein [Acetobacter sp. DsW_063]|uniref:lysozyme inhibitor LprI family protein n=1 Tax=Acetobacter sp. DsW_063 TaxID=1514894 RepID=UPI000A373DB0|nr:lysozyme inhibitor LprI family protein [Acetobacter sp. DsW_063]
MILRVFRGVKTVWRNGMKKHCLKKSIIFLCALNFSNAPSFAADCARTSTAIEKAICADNTLLEMDNKLNDDYAELLKKTSPKTEKPLRVQQRRWLQARNAQCSKNRTSNCLAPIYGRRIDELTALLSAADTQEDGLLDTINPIILRGLWSVGPLQKEQGEDGITSEDEQLSKQRLPKKGDQVTATPEGLCFNNGPCQPVSWSKVTLGSMPEARRYEQELHLDPAQELFSGRLSGKWNSPIILIPSQNGDMRAVAIVCAKGNEPCWNNFQPWRVKTN